jgi:hypothetical protein
MLQQNIRDCGWISNFLNFLYALYFHSEHTFLWKSGGKSCILLIKVVLDVFALRFFLRVQ